LLGRYLQEEGSLLSLPFSVLRSVTDPMTLSRTSQYKRTVLCPPGLSEEEEEAAAHTTAAGAATPRGDALLPASMLEEQRQVLGRTSPNLRETAIFAGQTVPHLRDTSGNLAPGCRPRSAAPTAPRCPGVGNSGAPRTPSSAQSLPGITLQGGTGGKHPAASPRARLRAFLPSAAAPGCSHPSWVLPMHPTLPRHRCTP